ncbi:MAG TPA: hypothetical protein VLE73_01315 [Candidatus Saccharimonadales bacterium]|nr:hypothetical protein [Candidatus Saccharimonadales bacterium]
MSAEVITIPDGIDRLATRFAEEYEPQQRLLMAGWRDWQRVVRTLGTPVLRNSHTYQLSHTELRVSACTEEGKIVETAAAVTVRGIARQTDHARRAITMLQRCQASGLTVLPTAKDELWREIEEATHTYRVIVEPTHPSALGEDEYLTQPKAYSHDQWADAIDVDGPGAAWEVAAMLADGQLEGYREAMSLFEKNNGTPGPQGDGVWLPRASGGTFDGILL